MSHQWCTMGPMRIWIDMKLYQMVFHSSTIVLLQIIRKSFWWLCLTMLFVWAKCPWSKLKKHQMLCKYDHVHLSFWFYRHRAKQFWHGNWYLVEASMPLILRSWWGHAALHGSESIERHQCCRHHWCSGQLFGHNSMRLLAFWDHKYLTRILWKGKLERLHHMYPDYL